MKSLRACFPVLLWRIA